MSAVLLTNIFLDLFHHIRPGIHFHFDKNRLRRTPLALRIPLVSLRVRDPSVGDVNPLQVASPLWASRKVGWRLCRSPAEVDEEVEGSKSGDKEEDVDGGGG